MLVSQYIYTACGKERTGAFSVFSKSKDITEEEGAEIREVMIYKTPSGLPYEPTESDIENLYPKKFGYFFLSSGRVCLAQVCYVGRVYSDLDGRFGNYIIHAFVFEKTDTLTPYGLIENDKFKRMLSRKEWHDDPIPNELPQIEIPDNGGVPSMNEVSSFLNEDRKNKLKLLIEAIINSSIENPVCFLDDHKNQRLWLKILSVCLPKAMQNKFSICTHFTNTLTPGNASSRVQIRVNQPESGMFNYAQEVQRRRYAFDFLRNIIPNSVKPGRYVETVVRLLPSNMFETVKFVDSINKVMSVYSVSINEASNLINLGKSDYSGFYNADEIVETVSVADRVGYETQTIAGNLNIGKPPFDFAAQQRLYIFEFVYKYIPAIETRVEIIKKVVDNAEQLGLRTDTASAFRDDLNSKAKFIFTNYLDYLKAEGLLNYITKNKNSFFKLFATFDFLLTKLPQTTRIFQTLKDNSSEDATAIINIMDSAFERRSIQDIDLLIKSADSRLNGLGIELLSVVVHKAINSGVRTANTAFAFCILQRLSSQTVIAHAYLLNMIKTVFPQDNVAFIKEYINAQNNDPDFYTKFEDGSKRDPLIADFCKKKDAFDFENQQLSLKVFKRYFDKYYITGADSGLFEKRLKEYIGGFQDEKRIKESIDILETLKIPATASKKFSTPVYNIVLEAIFSVPYDKVYKKLSKEHESATKISEIYGTIANDSIGLKQEIRELIVVTICGRKLEKYNFQDNSEILHFFKTQVDTLAAMLDIIDSKASIDTFIDYYFQPVADILIVGATLAGRIDDYDDILEKMFGKIIEKGNLGKLTDKIAGGVKKSKSKSIALILYIFRKLVNLKPSSGAFDKKLANIAQTYFEKISYGERKKKFDELLSLAERTTEAKQFERFFDKFNKDHPGGGIFGFLKKLFGGD
jgi:hypothetical protein